MQNWTKYCYVCIYETHKLKRVILWSTAGFKKFFRLYLLNLNCNNCNSNKPNDADVYNLTIIISWYKANLN